MTIITKLAKIAHRKIPYHNFDHANKVLNWAEQIWKLYSIKQETINSLLVACMFHDAWHLYHAKQEDEEKATQLAWKILEQIWFEKKNKAN